VTFEDVWNKIKAVKFTSILGFYGNVVVTTILIAFFAIVIVGAGLLVLKIFITIPWPYILFILVLASGLVCAKKWGWGKDVSGW